MFRLAFAYIFIFSFLIYSCKINKFTSSNVEHLAGNPIAPNLNPVNWIDMERNVFVDRFLLGMYANSSQDILPQSHPLQVIIDSWLVRFHQALQAKYPTKFNSIPMPRAVVYKNKIANGFIKSQTICFDLPVIVEGAEANIETSMALIEVIKGGFIQIGSRKCSENNPYENTPQLMVDFFNFYNPGCNAVLKNNQIAINSKCAAWKKYANTTFSGMAVTAAINVVSISSAMFEKFNTEENIVSLLAHELSHYYRSQLNRKKDYDFFYSTQTTSWTEEPLPTSDASLLQLKDELLLALNKATFYNNIPELTDSNYSFPVLQEVLNSYFDEYTESPVKQLMLQHTECSRAINLAKNMRSVFMDVTHFTKTPENIKALFSFDAEVKACFQSFGISANSDTIGAYNQFKSIINYAFGEERAKLLPVNFNKFIDAMDLYVAEIEIVRTQARILVRKAAELGLSKFTIEHEADSQATEMLDLVGINPVKYLDFRLARYKESSDENLEVDLLDDTYKICRKLLENNWQDLRTNNFPLEPFMGALLETHPNSCYRVYIVDKEIKAHNYNGKRNAVLNKESWQKNMLLFSEWLGVK